MSQDDHNKNEGVDKNSMSTWIPLLHSIVDWTHPNPSTVIDFVHPSVLLEKMEKMLQESKSSGVTTDSIFATVNWAMSHCVQTSHPLFVNQLYGGVHPLGLAASILIEKMNTNAYVAINFNKLYTIIIYRS